MTTLNSETWNEIAMTAARDILVWRKSSSATDVARIVERAISEALSRARSVTEVETPRTEEETESKPCPSGDGHEGCQWTEILEQGGPMLLCIQCGRQEPIVKDVSSLVVETPEIDASAFEVWTRDYGNLEVVPLEIAQDLARELAASIQQRDRDKATIESLQSQLSSRIPSGELGKLLKEVERLRQAATPGPWYFWENPDNDYIATGKDTGLLICALAGLVSRKNDFAFIAFARTALPRLARELAYQIELRGGIEFDRDTLESNGNAYREAMEEAHAKNKELSTKLEEAKIAVALTDRCFKDHEQLAQRATEQEAELSSLRDSCEAQRMEIEGLKNLLNERSS